MATSFNINKADLTFILKQIKIAEASSAAHTNAPVSVLQAIMNAYGVTAINAAQTPFGLRTVSGEDNNLLPGHSQLGAADALFPRLTDPVFINDADGDSIDFDLAGPGPTLTSGLVGGPGVIPGYGDYGVFADVNPGLAGNQPGVRTVVDADPRTISNLIVDMSVSNPAAIEAFLSNPLSVEAFEAAYPLVTDIHAWLVDPLNEAAANEMMKTIPNQSPDIGLSPGFNSWMTFFGQFFDHGLDLVTKGGNGTVYIPLQPDDPLYDHTPGATTNFMALTRATVTLDANGVPQHQNTTTSFVDQNQTYTSHESHQVFLREYVRDGSTTYATGKLLSGDGSENTVVGGIGNWDDVQESAITNLGLLLNDYDVHNVPLLKADQYGKFIAGANGYAQVAVAVTIVDSTTGVFIGDPANVAHRGGFVEGTFGGLDIHALTTANLSFGGALPALPVGQTYKVAVLGTGHAFLNDIAHHAAPSFVDLDHNPATPKTAQTADLDSVIGDDNDASTYDDEMLDSHFITGDGRGNENIALTTVHSIFHSEHDRLVDANKATILESGDLAFINEWLRVDIASLAEVASQGQRDALIADVVRWDGERLFQAARFTTEMQYQHLVFEEFARRIQPMVDPFIFNSSPDVDPSIVAEFAHTVYRFGHSMLTGTVDRLENDLTTVNGELDQKSLLAVFLNPQQYYASGGGSVDVATINANIIRGLSRDVGNEIDEMIVSDVRSSLLGLPLDLAALNIARGRDTGIPSLNETRAQLYNDTGLADLKPYDNWLNFAEHIKNPLSIVNFIAAYGTHPLIVAETTMAGKRAVAEELVFGVESDNVTPTDIADRDDFIMGVGDYAEGGLYGRLGGLNDVDLWIGGLAEAKNEFGGMLGSTFNYVFEAQMENLQNGDRMYYLTRTQGTNILNNLEPNTFTDLVMRNTDLGDIYSTHLNGALFTTPDHILELDRGIAQEDYREGHASLDPSWGAGEAHSPFNPNKVVRSYSGATTVVDPLTGITHDVGGSLKYFGGEHVVVGGTEGNDKIRTDRGIDTLWGDGGDDYLNAGTESDDVFGGEGNDVIEDPFGDDVLRGNQGDDVITSARGADLLFGDEGKDFISLGQDAAEAFGGEGDDFILGGDGKDFILGNEGSDWIEGGKGFDTLAGDNSELFFNSPLLGHDVMFNQGDEGDYDAEGGDDIMGSGASVFRYEGMFGFDWAIGKGEDRGVNFDAAIPIFTTIPNDILKDRFDQVEAFSGNKYDDTLSGDDRGHKGGGSSAPDSVPTELFAEHLLTQEGIDRIDGFNSWFEGGRTTLFGGASPVPGGQPATTFRDGNILMGGDGSDNLRGRGGFDMLDGDAYLNVRIRIVVGPTVYSAESLNTDTAVAGQYAGKVYNTYTAADELADPTHQAGSPNFDSVAFGGRSLQSLLLDRTISPSQMSIVREILYDETQVTGVGMNIDTAFFQGTRDEYDIEGITLQVNLNGAAPDTLSYIGEATDLNGDGFISVRDRDTGALGATIWRINAGGVAEQFTYSSRGLLTDDHDLLKNVEVLQFADQTVVIGGNRPSTGTVTISDPTPYDGLVTPYVGQVLTASLSGVSDPDGINFDSNGRPTNLHFEWQTTEFGSNSGWSVITVGDSYTVRSVDPGHVLRAVAVFEDADGNPERILSANTDNPTAAFRVLENSPNGTIVGLSVPFSPDYDPEPINGQPPVDADIATIYHEVDPNHNAGGRFEIIANGVDFNNRPRFSIVVDQGGPTYLDYEAPVHTPANQSHQFVDNQYQIVVNTYTDTPANGGVLIAIRQFTILLDDVTGEIVNVAPTLDLAGPVETSVTTQYLDNFNTQSMSNSNGTATWSSSWVETGDTASATPASTGGIRIDNLTIGNTLQLIDNGAGANASIRRTVDLAGATSASLSYSVSELNLSASETARVEFAADGVNFTTLQEIDQNSGAAFTNQNFALTGPFSATSAVRIVKVNFDNAGFSVVTLDNFAVTKTVTALGPNPAGNDYATSYTENGAGVAIASSPLIADMDDTHLNGATVKLTNAKPGDVLSTVALPGGIVASFGPAVAGEITMYLTGSATLAQYQTAISAVRFSNTSDTPDTTLRVLDVTVNDGVMDSMFAHTTITVAAVNDAPVVGGDTVITNAGAAAAFVIPEWALLANDTDVDGPNALDITAVANPVSVTGLSLATNPGSVTLTDNAALGGSFTYTASDGALPTTNGSVTVTNQRVHSIEDNFNEPVANNSSGLINWASSWVEANDGANTVTTGRIQIDGATQNQLRFGQGAAATITRAADLTGATNATMVLEFQKNSIEQGDNVSVQISGDGGVTWTTLSVISNNLLPGNGDMGGTMTLALPQALVGANTVFRFSATAFADANDVTTFNNIRIDYTPAVASITGTNAGEIIVGNADGTPINGGQGNDIIFAGNGDDIITQFAQEGRDFIDGGAGNDTYQLTGTGGETFTIYTASEALLAGFSGFRPGTEIVVTRQDGVNPTVVIAELDNIEEIIVNALDTTAQNGDGVVNGGVSGGSTVVVVGNFNAPNTSLAFNTITINGSDATDTVNIAGLSSEHRIVFNTNGGSDQVVGDLRPQDIVNGLASGGLATGGDLVSSEMTSLGGQVGAIVETFGFGGFDFASFDFASFDFGGFGGSFGGLLDQSFTFASKVPVMEDWAAQDLGKTDWAIQDYALLSDLGQIADATPFGAHDWSTGFEAFSRFDKFAIDGEWMGSNSDHDWMLR